MVTEDGLGEDVEDQVVRRVVAERDLLQDDPPLRFHVVGTDGGVAHHVREVVGAHGEVLVEHPAVDARVLLRGEGVGLTPDGVEGLGDVEGRVPGSPLEQKVLEEVRRAGHSRALIARAGAHP